jgi:hypothetical protein
MTDPTMGPWEALAERFANEDALDDLGIVIQLVDPLSGQPAPIHAWVAGPDEVIVSIIPIGYSEAVWAAQLPIGRPGLERIEALIDVLVDAGDRRPAARLWTQSVNDLSRMRRELDAIPTTQAHDG